MKIQYSIFVIIFTLILFIPLVPVFAQDGWYWQDPLPQGNRLNGVQFLDANTGTAVGDSGTIMRTTDGGDTWIIQSSGTTKMLFGVSFTGADTGTVVGESGTILRTTDGGDTWTSQISGTTGWLLGVSFTDANTGTAVGWSGVQLPKVVLRTTDGGASWTNQTSGTTVWLNNVSFTDANTGIVVGENGTILRTTNGGDTWTSQISGTSRHLSGVSFTDANTGTVVGSDGIILRTTTGGIVGIEDSQVFDSTIPKDYILFQNYPNPFNPSTTIEFSLPKSEFTTLNVFNILGKQVSTLVSKKLNSGNHTYTFDGKNLASGIYYYQLVAGEYREVKKMILIK